LGLPIHISADDIEAAFAPYVLQQFAPDSPDWTETIERLARKEQKRFERFLRNELPARDRARVETQYDAIWKRDLDDELIGRPAWFEWSRGSYLAHSAGRKHIHLLMLVRVLDAIAPHTVLEVGCGNGLNMLLLSAHFPQIAFTGLELTEAGVTAARLLLHRVDGVPANAARFFRHDIRDHAAPGRVRLQRGTAAQLPYRDGAFDVVYTVLALEQMESIRDAVLSEVRRVARRYVVMIEPFQELNADGLRRHFIASNHYFDARIDALHRFGLHPSFTYADIPNKVLFHVGLVVAECG
jgi:SAM-dependent methyltransferase